MGYIVTWCRIGLERGDTMRGTRCRMQDAAGAWRERGRKSFPGSRCARPTASSDRAMLRAPESNQSIKANGSEWESFFHGDVPRGKSWGGRRAVKLGQGESNRVKPKTG